MGYIATMSWWRDLVIGGVASAAFAAFGGWILWWSVGMAALSRASVDWPTAPGVVVASWLDTEGEATPRVTYRWEVAGVPHESQQLGFDVFDKPGGRGLARTRVARYPVGAAVTVYVDPADPGRAVLEPGDVSPFLLPMLFGTLFSTGGALMAWRTARHVTGGGPLVLSPEARVRAVGIGTTVLLGAALVLVSFDSAVQEVQGAAVGAWRPLGLSPTALFLLIQAVLFLPAPWFGVHLAALLTRRNEVGRPVVGAWGLVGAALEARRQGGPLAWSATVALLGLAYALAVMGGWIAFASWRGI